MSIFYVIILVATAAASPLVPVVQQQFVDSVRQSLSLRPSSQQHTLSTGQVVFGPAAVHSINNQDGVGNGNDDYRMYFGDGSNSQGWPDTSQWVSFENMFNNYKPQMFSSCSNMQNPQPNDSGPEIGAIYNAIQDVAIETNVDHRFILATIMQESSGCVRVPTTNFGVRNPGLMQDHDGSATCNDNGNVLNPCPEGTIIQMVRDGAAGTDSGDGLAGLINQAGGGNAQTFYRAARLYNSGSIDGSGSLEKGIAIHCYSSDIANRLTGWVNAPHGCGLDG